MLYHPPCSNHAKKRLSKAGVHVMCSLCTKCNRRPVKYNAPVKRNIPKRVYNKYSDGYTREQIQIKKCQEILQNLGIGKGVL